jgi:hypothetical protein
MFDVTPAFQGEEEDLPRSRSASLTLSSMVEISPRDPFKNPREFTILGDRAIKREIEEKGVEGTFLPPAPRLSFSTDTAQSP